jgi:hypothetical protein
MASLYHLYRTPAGDEDRFGARFLGKILLAWNLSPPFASNRMSYPAICVPRRAPVSIPPTLHKLGKVEGNTIKGNVEFERNGEQQKRDWEAKRKAD